MENIMQFLVVAGIIAFGIYRQINKEKSKESEEKRRMPIPPMPEVAEDASPIPDMWGKSFPYETAPKPVAKSKMTTQTTKTTSPRPTISSQAAQNQRVISAPSASSMQRIEETHEDFTINSAEEARRAIIWGEILQRKY